MKPAPLFALLLAVAGCKIQVTPPVITGVAMKVLPANGGTAYVAVDSTGRVTGGHMSGDPMPVVREDSARITPEQAADLFASARALGDTLLVPASPSLVEPPGSTVIAVLFSNETQARIVWQTGTRHPDARVNALAEKLMAQRVGGW